MFRKGVLQSWILSQISCPRSFPGEVPQSWLWRYPSPSGGVPQPQQGGYPSPSQKRVPQDRGTPARTGQGYPPPRRQNSTASTCYAAGGMPLRSHMRTFLFFGVNIGLNFVMCEQTFMILRLRRRMCF